MNVSQWTDFPLRKLTLRNILMNIKQQNKEKTNEVLKQTTQEKPLHNFKLTMEGEHMLQLNRAGISCRIFMFLQYFQIPHED